jgi:cobalt/nickel transport system permease protein
VSHIHIPDGVLPTWLWAAGWVLASALVAIASRVSERHDVSRKIPLLGVVSALVLVAMSSEIVPIAYHVNLTVLAGVLLGPWLAIVSAFVVQVTLALLGHGGVTVVGLNTLMTATEMVLGWLLFRGLVRALGRPRVRLSAVVATVLTLALATSLLVGIVAIAGAEGTERETGALDPGTLTFAAPFTDGVVEIGLFSGGEDTHEDGGGTLSVGRFATVVFTLGPLGWLIEALVTAGIIGYVATVRPSLIFKGALAERTRTRIGDEHGGH